MMSGALVPRSATAASSAIACRVPARNVANLNGSEELPLGLPVQVTFVAAHHCAGCGQPRSHAFHKDNPLIPGQVAPASLCRKCEKKIEQGKPIESIVLPIREFGSNEEAKQRGRRRRSTSRTRVVIREWSGDRDSPPRPAALNETSKPPPRTISYRHVTSRSLSRPATTRPPQQQQAEKTSVLDTKRRHSSPREHERHMIERRRSETLQSNTRSQTMQPPKSTPPRPSGYGRRDRDDDYYHYVAVDVGEGHSRDAASIERKHMTVRGASSPARRSHHDDSTPPPPVGLSAVRSKCMYYHRKESEEQTLGTQASPALCPQTFDKFIQNIFRGKNVL